MGEVVFEGATTNVQSELVHDGVGWTERGKEGRAVKRCESNACGAQCGLRLTYAKRMRVMSSGGGRLTLTVCLDSYACFGIVVCVLLCECAMSVILPFGLFLLTLCTCVVDFFRLSFVMLPASFRVFVLFLTLVILLFEVQVGASFDSSYPI